MTKTHASITHTLTHLGAVAFILAVVFLISLVAKDVTVPESQLAQSSGALLPSDTMPVLSGNLSGGNTTNTYISPSMTPVSFLVSVPEESFCENGENMKAVAILISPPEAGTIVLTRTEDLSTRTVGSMPVPLRNGTYIWNGIPMSGYQTDGAARGEFTISGECTGTTRNPIPVIMGSASEGIESTVSPEASRDSIPLPVVPVKAFMGNTLVPDGATVSGIVELRLVSTDSMKVEFIDTGTRVRLPLGTATVDQVLSTATQDVWSFYWDTTAYPNRTYSIIAKTVQTDGKVAETIPISLVVSNTPSQRDASMNKSGETTTATSGSVENAVAKTVAPSGCSSPEECKVYCRSTSARRELCEKYVTKPVVTNSDQMPPSPPQFLTDEPSITDETREQKIARGFIEERQGARAFLDLDDDGISDFDEINLYGTNPAMFDTDGDGVPDGAEILARTNPLGNVSTDVGDLAGEYVAYEDPRASTVLIPDVLSVAAVTVVATTTDAAGNLQAARIAFSGYALPNAFVTIYIFSDPIIVTVKTDASGAWTYTLDRNLPDGAHEVMIAIVDAGGKIIARSESFPFVKQAAAISIGSEPVVFAEKTAPGFFNGSALIAFFAVLLGTLGIAVSVVGFTVRHHHADVLRHT